MKITKEASKQKSILTYPSQYSGFSSDHINLSLSVNLSVSPTLPCICTEILTRSTLSLVVQGSNGVISKSRAINLYKGINMAHVINVSMPNIQTNL